MSVPDVQKLNGPLWLAVFVSGLVFSSAAVSFFYERVRLPALEERLRLANDAKDDSEQKLLEQSAALRKAKEDSQLVAQSLRAQPTNAETVQIRSNLQQCLRNSEDWQAAYAKLSPRADLRTQLDDDRREHAEISARIINYSISACRGAQNTATCDLNLTSQRTLQGMKERRDQLHEQILGLQRKVECTKP
jgi:hypothetical protein